VEDYFYEFSLVVNTGCFFLKKGLLVAKIVLPVIHTLTLETIAIIAITAI
jgi:hypothetical protein